MKELLRKYSIIVFLSFLVIVLIFLKVIYRNTGKQAENNKIIPTVIPIIESTPTPFPSTQTDSYDPEPGYIYTIFLPYQGEKIRIEKYIKPYILEILIKKEGDEAEAEIEAKKWLEENETYPENTSFVFKIQE